MFKKSVLILSLIALCSSCATPLSKKEANITFVEKTNLKKEEAYDKAVSYLAKNLNDSNEAIKLKNPKKAKLITKIGIECDELAGVADITSYTAYFTLDARFKDQKTRLDFTADSYSQVNIDGTIITADGQFRKGHKEGVESCAKKLKKNLLSALKQGSTSEDW